MSHFNGLLHLRGCVDKYVGIWAGGRSMRETRVDKQAGRGPKWFNSRALLLFFEHFDDSVEVAVRLREAGPFWRHVPIVKGVEGCSQFLDKFERDARAIACVFKRV